MSRTCRLRPTRAWFTFPAAAAVVFVGLSACSFEVSGPSEGEAQEMGTEYGETLAGTIGARATTQELEDLCGQGAVEEGIVTKGREGDETDLEVDAFIEACRQAVEAGQ